MGLALFIRHMRYLGTEEPSPGVVRCNVLVFEARFACPFQIVNLDLADYLVKVEAQLPH